MEGDMGYDVIGDIHGEAGKLKALLRELGYTETAACWRPPQGRQAIIVGDLIDRGPDQVEVVDIVRRMVDAGHARCVMGNHEYNAIGFVTRRPDDSGQFIRRHSEKNVRQHAEFLRQVGKDSALHTELVDWFRTLPPMLDLGGIRVVHAWCQPEHADHVATRLSAGKGMDEGFLHATADRKGPLWAAMEGLTKGCEIRLPEGYSFIDPQGVERHEVRTAWWQPDPRSYRDVAMVGEAQAHRIPDLPLPASYRPGPVDGSPVVVGHYWMTGAPAPLSPKVACVDYSAAKGGPLVAYRWDGETELDARRFVASH
jgi:hypothetical protein